MSAGSKKTQMAVWALVFRLLDHLLLGQSIILGVAFIVAGTGFSDAARIAGEATCIGEVKTDPEREGEYYIATKQVESRVRKLQINEPTHCQFNGGTSDGRKILAMCPRDSRCKVAAYVESAGMVKDYVYLAIVKLHSVAASKGTNQGTASQDKIAPACFLRQYNRAHLAKHADQIVTAVKLSIKSGERDAHYPYIFLLQVKIRGKDKILQTGGSCETKGAGMRYSVECDGGGIYVEPHKGLCKDVP